jgi:hypothetical protein
MKNNQKKIKVVNFLLLFFVASLLFMGCQTINKKIANINNGMTIKEVSQRVKKMNVIGSKKIGQSNAAVYAVKGRNSGTLGSAYSLLYFIDGELVKYRIYDQYMLIQYRIAAENWEKRIDELYKNSTPDTFY